MSKGAGQQTVTNRLDPAAERFRNETYDAARRIYAQGPSQYGGPMVAGPNDYMSRATSGVGGVANTFGGIGSAAQNFQLPGGINFGSGVADRTFGQSFDPMAYNRAGRVGANALAGDQGAVDQMMNPYMQNVIGAMGGEYDRMRDKSIMDVNDIATKGGAFGGDRQALLQGERLGEIDRAQSSTMADLLRGGYNDMVNRAGAAANLGLGAGGLGRDFESLGANFALGQGDQRLRGQGLAADYGIARGNLGLGALDAQTRAALGQQSALGDLFKMGSGYRDINQQMIDANIGKFNEARDWDFRGLGAMTGAMSGLPVGNTQSQPLYRNAGAGLMGGALTGAQIGSMFPGAGNLIGAGVGGLLGLFS